MNISTDKTTPVSINRNFARKQLMPLTIFSVAQSITLSSLPEFLHLPPTLRYSSDPFVFDQICKEELSVHFPHISQGRTKFPSCFWNWKQSNERFRRILKCFSSIGHYVAPSWQLQLDLIARYMAVLNSRSDNIRQRQRQFCKHYRDLVAL